MARSLINTDAGLVMIVVGWVPGGSGSGTAAAGLAACLLGCCCCCCCSAHYRRYPVRWRALQPTPRCIRSPPVRHLDLAGGGPGPPAARGPAGGDVSARQKRSGRCGAAAKMMGAARARRARASPWRALVVRRRAVTLADRAACAAHRPPGRLSAGGLPAWWLTG
eukprot:scaffold331_cov349-Prasinococcus_capsulatus_cf.AAC.5